MNNRKKIQTHEKNNLLFLPSQIWTKKDPFLILVKLKGKEKGGLKKKELIEITFVAAEEAT